VEGGGGGRRGVGVGNGKKELGEEECGVREPGRGAKGSPDELKAEMMGGWVDQYNGRGSAWGEGRDVVEGGQARASCWPGCRMSGGCERKRGKTGKMGGDGSVWGRGEQGSERE